MLETAFYPVMLNLKNEKCVIVGGGIVALRKCMALLECEASITVISPKFLSEFDRFVEERILFIRDVFRTYYIEDSFLVIAATEEKETNREISQYCKKNKILVNVADELEYCSFIAPAFFRRGDLTISVSTGGKAPALAKKIKENIEKSYPAEYAQYVNTMGLLRASIMKKGYSQEERMQILASLTNMTYNELLEYCKSDST